MVGRRSFPFGKAHFQGALAVSFEEGIGTKKTGRQMNSQIGTGREGPTTLTFTQHPLVVHGVFVARNSSYSTTPLLLVSMTRKRSLMSPESNCGPKRSSPRKRDGPNLFFVNSHRIHVWYIYLHLVDFYGKCR